MSGPPTSDRGFAGSLERSWSGRPGTMAWTLALAPLSLGYAAGSAVARARASSSRRGIDGAPVLCVGGLTVGGSGKSSLVRWLAEAILARGGRPAVVSRGHGREDATGTLVLPDTTDYPAERLARFGGDEAAALRAALDASTVVAVGRDRRRSAVRAIAGYGATSVLLDDGWEQGSLAWDRLWVAVDPIHPFGNGWMLPAGPLRRPPRTLREAHVVAFVLEPGDEIGDATLRAVREHAPRAAVLRFRRSLDRRTPLARHDDLADASLSGKTVALVTAVGAPERVERLVAASGARVVHHASFPDHARFREDDLARALERGASAGASEALITEKDEARWPHSLRASLPVHVLRTRLTPLDPVEPHLVGLVPAGGAVSRDALGFTSSGATRSS
ncbi:MAG TPA: tetraacyldisaccharide 4'-kinase [Candidatus Eisenbacteria bacterium]|nr:tetraacyldisaccharide 4'-kinase [Candidatus Eisenbacteria bacterium]